MIKHGPEALLRPRWLADWLRSGAIPQLGVPNFRVSASDPIPGFFEAYGTWMGTPPPTWEDIAWLREHTRLPILLKGITHPDDARLAVQHGAAGIIVSNHGGRTLDTLPATAQLLPEVVEAVQGAVPVLVDGGIRRGTDVLKAMALGASAVLVGRPVLHGLTNAGAVGVAHVLRLLRDELEMAMALCGCASLVCDGSAARSLSPDAPIGIHEIFK